MLKDNAFEALIERVVRLATGRGGDSPRPIIGITGSPGSGKSTLAERLAAATTARGVPAAHLPMDGFHLADAELVRLGRRDRKGAIDTFDVNGYVALLRRVRTDRTHTVYAPDFDRTLHQPTAGAIPVLPEHGVVLTEGNYLLSPDPAWRSVRGLLDEVWFCDLAPDERRRRLATRHERSGKSPEAARAWVADVDEPNASMVAAWAGSADLVVETANLGLPPARD